MALTRKNHYRGSDFNSKELKEVGSIQLLQDAVNEDHAVR